MDHIDKDVQDDANDFSFDDLDNEVGLGNILKEKDSFLLLFFKKLVFGIVIIIIGIIVFFASFTIGKMMFLAEDNSSYRNEQPILNEISENKIITTQPNIEPQVSMKSTQDESKTLLIPTQNNIQINSQDLPQTNRVKVLEVKPSEVKEIKEVKKVQTKNTEQPKIVENKYIIVTGTFSKIQNARLLSNSLQKMSFTPTIKNISGAKGETLYRVIAGIYNNLTETNKQIKILKSKGVDCFSEQFKE